MEDNNDFETDTDAEDDVKVNFKNEIPDESLVPPAKPVSRIRKLSFSFVALLLILVGLINLAMILWILWRRLF
jgi:hypothetical protein